MKRMLAVVIPLFSVGIDAETIDQPNLQVEQRALILSVLLQPIDKQIQCAKLGYIGYQNALSARYLNDKKNKDLVKSYAWNLVSAGQIKTIGNAELNSSQEQASAMLRDKMTPEQIKAGEKMSQEITTQYGKTWPSADSQVKLVDFPAPCSVSEMYKTVLKKLGG